MAQYTKDLAADSLKDKAIVLTGGANGIGASLVEYATSNGAFVCFGDLAVKAGETLAKKVNDDHRSSPPRAVFVRTDVTNYESVLGLFDKAMSVYGKIDHAVAGAGITEIGNVFNPTLDMTSIRTPPTTKVMDINMNGCLYVARIASVYLRQNRTSGEQQDRSIILVSSIAGFKESPGLFIYQASKHGVLGLMRALRLYLPPVHGIRINAICPWMTMTGMVTGVQDGWRRAGLPVNSPMDVAVVMGRVLGDRGLNGTAMYVEGGRAWEIEGKIDELEPLWLGEECSRTLKRGQEVLGSGSGWTEGK
ncbi:hypothetical protein BDV19DRAFT_380350 [Aspergillus venezuelensis]